ncbi:uncharacterized protein G2W53_011227 [Senna tora]|uniref:Uncharacterized protein n=1 Tax=Senna tora TaxID=362788 RepID=A0A834X2K9_9FABA|nr:uncharacterized protein G2W53_011227 [Senna tora]
MPAAAGLLIGSPYLIGILIACLRCFLATAYVQHELQLQKLVLLTL